MGKISSTTASRASNAGGRETWSRPGSVGVARYVAPRDLGEHLVDVPGREGVTGGQADGVDLAARAALRLLAARVAQFLADPLGYGRALPARGLADVRELLVPQHDLQTLAHVEISAPC